MSDAAPAASEDVFAERLPLVINQGKRIGTNKLALLLALIDACGAEADAHGRAPAALHTRTIAHHVLYLPTPQAHTYLAGEEPRHIDQIPAAARRCSEGSFALHVRAESAQCRSLVDATNLLDDDVNDFDGDVWIYHRSTE